MRLDAIARTAAGLASNVRFLTRSTGEPLHVPNALYVLDDGMAAIPHMELATDEQVTIDLSTWSLHDMERDRPTGLELTRPSSEQLSQVATRYVREARRLPQHELAAWAQRLVSESPA